MTDHDQLRAPHPPWEIRARRAADDDAIGRVNADNVPEVGVLDPDRLALFTATAAAFDVVEVHTTDGGVTIEGIFVGLAEGLDYASPNYRWFADRHERFAYVDRIALQPVLRGLGVAQRIYSDFEAWARRTGRPVVCAEVNVIPPNPRSLRFHTRLGFEVVDELAPYGGSERVAMVVKHLADLER